jgi:hypothetical protein
VNRRNRLENAKFPVITLLIRELLGGEWFASDCVIHQRGIANRLSGLRSGPRVNGEAISAAPKAVMEISRLEPLRVGAISLRRPRTCKISRGTVATLHFGLGGARECEVDASQTQLDGREMPPLKKATPPRCGSTTWVHNGFEEYRVPSPGQKFFRSG